MAVRIGLKPKHVGGFIKRSILPDDMSVTQAADILSVGRPALSTLLNEKASLSPEMALRIEKAFGVKMETLLKMQARYDADQMRERESDIQVKPFDYGCSAVLVCVAYVDPIMARKYVKHNREFKNNNVHFIEYIISISILRAIIRITGAKYLLAKEY